MTEPTTRRRPVLLGLAGSAVLTALVVIGSRNLEHYDPKLFGYTVASIVAFGALVFRYAVWLQRPATRVYWRRGWLLFRERKKLAANTKSAALTVGRNLIEQRFIARRGFSRWLMHALIMWGCVLSSLVTFPLVFGWIHFKLEGIQGYRAYVFGFPTSVVQGRSVLAWVTFHVLDFTAIMVIAGCAIAMHRRLHDRGAIAQKGGKPGTVRLTPAQARSLVLGRPEAQPAYSVSEAFARRQPTRGHSALEQARLIMLVMINVAQLWILSATVEAALAHSYQEMWPLVIASLCPGLCSTILARYRVLSQ